MILEVLPKEFEQANPVLNRLIVSGYEAYFVGGSVRDTLLGEPIHDVDIATNAYPDEVKTVFLKTVDIGIEHGTVLVLFNGESYEITTFRTESTYQDFRRPDQVTFVRSLEEDLKRRDFTINALALAPDGTVIDLFNGIHDLENQVLKAVGNPKERFHEDALRMMRGLRFASQLDFEIEEQTLGAIFEYHYLLEKISIERIQIEFTKLILGKNRCNGIIPLVETGCYLFCPGFADKSKGLLKFSKLDSKTFLSAEAAWSLLLYCLEIQPAEVQSFLKQWKFSNQFIQTVTQCLAGLYFRLKQTWDFWEFYQLGSEKVLLVERLLPYLNEIPDMERVNYLTENLVINEMNEMNINGRILLQNLSKEPGAWLGKLLHELEFQVVMGNVANDQESLLKYAKEYQIKDEK